MLATYLESLPPLDWNDLHSSAVVAEGALRHIAADRPGLRALLLAVPDNARLFAKCESDTVEDKIVLYDDPDRGLRLRLRIATAEQRILAHSHRFSFSNLVLRGSYLHRNYGYDGLFSKATSPRDIWPLCLHEDRPGDCFTIHHSAVHATPLEEAGTVSLVLRGPAEKERAPVVPLGHGRAFSRIGEAEESTERRAVRRMSRTTFDHWVERLGDYALI